MTVIALHTPGADSSVTLRDSWYVFNASLYLGATAQESLGLRGYSRTKKGVDPLYARYVS